MKKKYDDLIRTWDNSLIDLCFVLYDELSIIHEKERISKFKFLCEYIDNVDIDFKKEYKNFKEDEITYYKKIYGEYIDESINIARIKADFSSCDFYKCLWDIVFNDNVFSNLKEKSFALYWILIDNRIPYIKSDKPLNLNEEEINKIIKENKDVIEKIYYIFSLPLEKRTETASLLLKELLEIKDFSTQVVLFVKILNISDEYENRNTRKLMNLLNNQTLEE